MLFMRRSWDGLVGNLSLVVSKKFVAYAIMDENVHSASTSYDFKLKEKALYSKLFPPKSGWRMELSIYSANSYYT